MPDLPFNLFWLLFATSFFGIVTIFALSFAGQFHKEFQFFPPPEKDCWQHRLFLALFRIFLYPLIALSILSFEADSGSLLEHILGAIMLLVGFGFAFQITFRMGWKNAFGEKQGLRTDGWFRYSRNPVYVATWIGLIGWAVLTPHPLVVFLLAPWALMYLLAPIFEEPWLEQQYGEAYTDYKRSTPRFFFGF